MGREEEKKSGWEEKKRWEEIEEMGREEEDNCVCVCVIPPCTTITNTHSLSMSLSFSSLSYSLSYRPSSWPPSPHRTTLGVSSLTYSSRTTIPRYVTVVCAVAGAGVVVP